MPVPRKDLLTECPALGHMGRGQENGDSLDEHGVAVAEESVVLRDRQRVEAALLFQSHHGGDQRDECAAGEVEVGDQRPDVLPRVAGADEDSRLGARGANGSPAGWLSSTRADVVPTATIRRPSCFARFNASAASALIV